MLPFHKFIDRTEDLFGRQADIDYLLDRVQHTGLTAICGRPQMGKTWLLQGRRTGYRGVTRRPVLAPPLFPNMLYS
jgi:hypothetical protein